MHPGITDSGSAGAEELGFSVSEKQWQTAFMLAHKCSLSTRTQETAYKLLTRWYAIPVKLHSWFPQTPDTCWRCHSEKGTLLHIWWHCPGIQPFWSKGKELIFQITDTLLKLDAVGCLLHVTRFTIKKYKNSLSKHLLNTAKALIPLFWKSSGIPTIQGWLHKVIEICKMQETVAQAGNNATSFHETWSPWFIFEYSQAYTILTDTKQP